MNEPDEMPESDRRMSNKARRRKAFALLNNVFTRAQALSVLRAIELIAEKREPEEPSP